MKIKTKKYEDKNEIILSMIYLSLFQNSLILSTTIIILTSILFLINDFIYALTILIAISYFMFLGIKFYILSLKIKEELEIYEK